MKIRIVSDLHIDINKDGNFAFRNKTEEDVLLIAGDIAGSYEREKKFLTNLGNQIKIPIYCVAGNHLGYDYFLYPYDREVGTKQGSIDYLKKNLPENVHYMDDEYVDLGEYILFCGTMYTDYKLYPNQYLCMQSSGSWLNDFRYVYIKDKQVIRRITPTDYTKYFKTFKRKLNKCIKETDKDIIVMTHFAPSIKSISEKYLKGNDVYLNASYASDLEKYILSNKRIKYWIHGHVHDSFDYEIGQCRVLCEPYGYHINGEQPLPTDKWYGKLIEI